VKPTVNVFGMHEMDSVGSVDGANPSNMPTQSSKLQIQPLFRWLPCTNIESPPVWDIFYIMNVADDDVVI